MKAEAKARNLQGIRDTISLVHSASHTSLRFAGDAGPPATGKPRESQLWLPLIMRVIVDITVAPS